ncbi:MAG: hypothetical protein KatS3mg132_422 [Limisphaera sp.]|nr:MAG: hypothetical protein KatS3mg132_422 [Limisphaera sp.]
MDIFWSIFCVPIGVLICFGPALIAWVFAERRSGSNPEQSADVNSTVSHGP